MNKLIIVSGIAAALAIGTGIICYFNWPSGQRTDQKIPVAPQTDNSAPPGQDAANDANIDTSAISQLADGTAANEKPAAASAPAPAAAANPLQKAPDLNPARQGNPIRKIKTNPFE